MPNDKAFAKDLLRKWKATKDLKYLRDELFWQCFDNHCKRKEVEEFTQEYRKQEKVSKILRIILSFLYLLYLSTYHCVIIYYSIHSFIGEASE